MRTVKVICPKCKGKEICKFKKDLETFIDLVNKGDAAFLIDENSRIEADIIYCKYYDMLHNIKEKIYG